MSALIDVKFRARKAIAAFDRDHARPLDASSCLKMQDLLLQFADEIIEASEIDGLELEADQLDDLFGSIEYFQDRVLETKPA